MAKFRGTLVIARAYGERYILRRIWAVWPWAIELTDDRGLSRLSRGAPGPTPIPFPREDVYCYDPGLRSAIDADAPFDLARLSMWTPDAK